MTWLLQQSWTVDAQGARMLVPARTSHLCGWFMTSGTLSSLEEVPLCFHNFCRNNCKGKVCAQRFLQQLIRVSTPSSQEGLLGQEELAPPSLLIQS